MSVRICLDRGLFAATLAATWAATYAGAWWYWHEHLHLVDRPFWAGLPVALAIGWLLLTVRRELYVNRYGITFTRWPWPPRHVPRHEWQLVAVAKREGHLPRRTVWEVIGGTRAGPVRLSLASSCDRRTEALATRVRAALGPPPQWT